jgi:hypothetical protein
MLLNMAAGSMASVIYKITIANTNATVIDPNPTPTQDMRLLEDGSIRLLEDGGSRLLENNT